MRSTTESGRARSLKRRTELFHMRSRDPMCQWELDFAVVELLDVWLLGVLGS